MSNHEGKYNIKAVSKMLGIQAGTLRAWERRYNMIAPIRNESGHRLYTEEHIKILKWLITKVDKGFTISQAVNLLETNQASINEQVELKTDGEQIDYSEDLMEELLYALLKFDESTAHDLLNKAFSLYSVDKVVIEILGTLLVKIGDKWENGKITSAHEHFASSFLRSRIGMILHTLPVDGLLPKVIGVCGPEESHELGLLIFTLYLRRKGFEVIYLGTSIAEGDIDIVLNEVKPEFLFLSCTLVRNVKKTLELVDELSLKYDSLQIGLGGKAFSKVTPQILEPYASFLLGEDKQHWESWLRDRLGMKNQ
ncbi:MerR family transcriptional regulator [Metabacillus litoralis]|uniref:MerR family transcriptional regulator n=1 Tax=Metabacillus litoralis TaxID=152268 RepID=UPI001B924256|nr:MerR family transcriptional regulator [Metabacillus litoralis]MCM3163134.1 MerR family transcriptional regulator [Metabacillus litoralis]MCM3410840.1 MerR family transcriptional regulator [Metabacillus litoralis]UHA58076.1 MerR family transcriptional regulator [Metabacillus litoralis]